LTTSREANEFFGRPYRYARQRILWIQAFLRNLGMGSALAVIAGLINSVALLGLGSFVSHISGHATRAAVEWSEGHTILALSFFFATGLFVAGAFVTTLCLRGQTIERRTRRFMVPLWLEMCCICYVVLYATADGRLLLQSLNFHLPSPASVQQNSNFIYVLSFAMGLQNALIRQASGTIVRTTHMTGVATDIGISLATAVLIFFEEAKTTWKSKPRLFLFAPALLPAFFRVFRFERLLLHLGVFSAFLLGACLGTWGYLKYGFEILYCPAGLIAFILLREIPKNRKSEKSLTENTR
jgi:uncharacterized membrane protein YoaK (UPF0700 family)